MIVVGDPVDYPQARLYVKHFVRQIWATGYVQMPVYLADESFSTMEVVRE